MTSRSDEASEAAGTEPAASLSAQQGFVAGYLLQDILRLREQGHRASPAWIKRHGLLVGLVGDNRKLALRLARRSRCLACAVELPSGSTGDHVIALAAGGPAGAENFLPLCGRCNASKGTSDFLVWWRQKGRSALELGPDALCSYIRLAFAHQRRLGSLNDPAAAALAETIAELRDELLDEEQDSMTRQRVSWMTGRKW